MPTHLRRHRGFPACLPRGTMTEPCRSTAQRPEEAIEVTDSSGPTLRRTPMRRTVRTAAIVVGAAAATGVGLATAAAQPDAATAQAPQSYQLTSSTMTVPVNFLNYPTSPGLCADGYPPARARAPAAGPPVVSVDQLDHDRPRQLLELSDISWPVRGRLPRRRRLGPSTGTAGAVPAFRARQRRLRHLHLQRRPRRKYPERQRQQWPPLLSRIDSHPRQPLLDAGKAGVLHLDVRSQLSTTSAPRGRPAARRAARVRGRRGRRCPRADTDRPSSGRSSRRRPA